MGTYLRVFDSHEDYESYENSIQFKRPNVCVCLTENMEAHYNQSRNKIYGTQYLTFELVTAGTITIQATNSSIANKTIFYSYNNGSTWNSVTTSTTALSLGSSYPAGQKILIKGLNNIYANSLYYTKFGGSAQYKIYGNIMSLIYGDDFIGQTSFQSGSTHNFSHLFYQSTGLVDASNLILPAITLANACYRNMFHGCTSLVQAPELPGATLTYYCYYQMFSGCTSLITAPELPATTLANNCYSSMFSNCTGLIQAPELPATTLANNCYYSMFFGCTGLTQAPEKLPATTLAQGCYSTMFNNCASLTTAPELPATTLVTDCYEYMFSGCTSLNYIKAMFTTTPGSSYTAIWVDGVASSGTFIKNEIATWDVTGSNGIPSGWTVQTASS